MASQGISRRTALAAGLGLGAAAAAGGYGLVEAGTLPGKYRLARLLGACGSPPPPPRGPLPDRHQAQFWSAYRGRRVNMITLIPAGARSPHGLGVVVALHGLGGGAAGTASILARAMASVAARACNGSPDRRRPAPSWRAATTTPSGAKPAGRADIHQRLPDGMTRNC